MFGGSGGFDAGTQFAGGGFMPNRCEAGRGEARGSDTRRKLGRWVHETCVERMLT